MKPETDGYKIKLTTGETFVRNGKGVYVSITDSGSKFIVDKDYVIDELVADIKSGVFMRMEITKEQTESICYLRGKKNDDRTILRDHGAYAYNCRSLNDLTLLALAKALIHGYETVMTPEESVRVYYEKIKRRSDRDDLYGNYSAKMSAVRETLDRIGIKIEGVNVDHEEADVDDAPF